jgi:hypothetical protein
MKKFLSFLFLALSVVLITTGSLKAQRGLSAPPPPPPPVDNLLDTPSDMPFDGGLSLVAIAGIAYAAKKGYDRRKKK